MVSGCGVVSDVRGLTELEETLKTRTGTYGVLQPRQQALLAGVQADSQCHRRAAAAATPGQGSGSRALGLAWREPCSALAQRGQGVAVSGCRNDPSALEDHGVVVLVSFS